jgi:hypothetical protein
VGPLEQEVQAASRDAHRHAAAADGAIEEAPGGQERVADVLGRQAEPLLAGEQAVLRIAGVEVVAAAPRYHRVRVEAQLVTTPEADPTTVVRAAAAAIDRYLDPIVGGEAGRGWPFGGALRYVPLVQRVLAVADVRAVSRLDFVVDGMRVPPCTDRTLSPNSLVWPDVHELTAVAEAVA